VLQKIATSSFVRPVANDDDDKETHLLESSFTVQAEQDVVTPLLYVVTPPFIHALVCTAPPSDRWRSRLLLLLLLLHLLLGRGNYIEARLREFREARAKEAIEKAKAERGVDWRDKEETTEKEFDLRGAFARPPPTTLFS
jgi:hypothetical protein